MADGTDDDIASRLAQTETDIKFLKQQLGIHAENTEAAMTAMKQNNASLDDLAGRVTKLEAPKTS